MIHPWDPRYIKHNEQLRKAELAWTQQYLTHPDEQDLRSVAWKEKFLKDFPDLSNGEYRQQIDGGEFLAIEELMLFKFKEVAEYDPMIPWPDGEERFVEEWGFLPELVF